MLHKNYAYYNHQTANILKPVALAMLGDRLPRKFKAKDYGKTIESLLKMIQRGALFLADQEVSSDTKTFTEWRDNVTIAKLSDGVLIRWKYPPLQGQITEDIKGNIGRVEREQERRNLSWQSDLDTFICDGVAPCEIKIEGLWLDESDIAAARASVVGLAGIEIVEVSKHKIVMRKLS